MTLTAEIGGVALALQLASSVGPLLWVPVAAFAVWIVIWRVKFSIMENVTGLLGLTSDRVRGQPVPVGARLGQLTHQALAPVIPDTESAATYWYYAIALFGAAMTPYEVFFFSSGAVEEKWTVKDLGTSRLNVLVGFPLGGVLSVAIAACAAVVLLPGQIEVTSLSQITMPVLAAGGQLALAFTIVGIAAATFGAALETTLSSGYTLAQFFGWAWGKFRRPADAARFHVVMLIVVVACAAVLFTGVDPILVTEYSVVFSAIALPLTYLPILIVANDPGYMGEYVNGRALNVAASVYLVHHSRGLTGRYPADDRHWSWPMSSSRNDFPDAPRPSGRLIDARLHLLDRQLFDADDAPVGIVDDLDVDIPMDVDIAASVPAPLVTGILTGQVLATRIFGGRPPRSKLQAIPWRLITKIGTVVQLSADAEDFDSLWLEHWLRDHIIRRIPGGRRAAQ